MSDANFASLSSTLLARKGGAKPAMRPQSGIVGPVDGKEAAANLEDLGWNDMGDDEQGSPKPSEEKVVALAPSAANETAAPNQVRESLTKIQAQLEKPAQSKPVARKPAAAQGKRAAFTLRLDQERHLMLRLACTVRGRSAQQLVTDALDALLAEMPEIASLAAQVQRGKN
ncbi:hypothetical protein [Erythrobacter sp. AP23]|uniref:hypothetical protein n=1 Tax=Erythrobacter sp. AP23 TaxID=499656 RepID=UPI00076C2EA7|nr:hypothetical protein [Erythrobacter sp. AP23]KWV92546.1 hypothetical protein ASS64_14960 [Erythrobacter sp. AP23]